MPVVRVRNCDVCGKPFESTSSTRKRCSEQCAHTAKLANITANILTRYRNDPAFRDRTITAAQNRRAATLGIEQITTQAQLVAYLLQRDKRRCGICRQPVRAQRGPMRPSIDHIVPLSAGGKHELENVQLAHYRCNLSKNNRGGGQPLLIG